MTVGGIWVFVFGCAGGFVAEYVGVWNLRKEEPHLWPAYFKRFRYYAISAVMVLMGGGLAVIYGMNPMPAILALNIGASAPLIIQKLTQTIPPPATPVPPGARVG